MTAVRPTGAPTSRDEIAAAFGGPGAGAGETLAVARRLHAEIERNRVTLTKRSAALADRQQALSYRRQRLEVEAFDVVEARDLADALAALHVELEAHASAWVQLDGRAKAVAQLVDDVVGDGVSSVGPRARRLAAV